MIPIAAHWISNLVYKYYCSIKPKFGFQLSGYQCHHWWYACENSLTKQYLKVTCWIPHLRCEILCRCFTCVRSRTTAWWWRASSVQSPRCSTRPSSSATGGSTWIVGPPVSSMTATSPSRRAISWWRLWRSSLHTATRRSPTLREFYSQSKVRPTYEHCK